MVDTNVVVSALLHPERTPDRALAAARGHQAMILVDSRIEAEYRAVLDRPKFEAIEPARRDALLESLLGGAERIGPIHAFGGALIDEDDRMFVEVALSGRADAIVTGNSKHYPRDLGVDILGPTELLALLSPRKR